MIFNFLRNIYRKAVPKNIRARMWENANNRKQYKFNLNSIKYIQKNADSLTDEDNILISLVKSNLYIESENFKKLQSKWELIKYLEKENSKNNEKIEIKNYLKRNAVAMLPYDFIKKYDYNDVIIYNENDNKYVLHENKRMYFPKNWKDDKIQIYYNSLLQEQNTDSPHRYEYGMVQVNSGDVVVDIGASEGFFALSVIEKAKKIYLFECNELWNDILEMTFSPYKEKVVIVNKYVGDYTDGNTTTMDHFFNGGQEVNFIKADIEGAELKYLKGSYNLLRASKNIKLTICTYHNKNDAQKIKQILLKNNFYVEFSKGYILSNWEKKYRLRKGLIRGHK
jgi:hypothetical protein